MPPFATLRKLNQTVCSLLFADIKWNVRNSGQYTSIFTSFCLQFVYRKEKQEFQKIHLYDFFPIRTNYTYKTKHKQKQTNKQTNKNKTKKQTKQNKNKTKTKTKQKQKQNKKNINKSKTQKTKQKKQKTETKIQRQKSVHLSPLLYLDVILFNRIV